MLSLVSMDFVLNNDIVVNNNILEKMSNENYAIVYIFLACFLNKTQKYK